MKPNVLVLGTFDLLHFGHMHFLQQCRTRGIVTVGLSSDVNASRQRRPIMDYAERTTTLLMLPWVQYVHIKSEASARPIIEKLKPHIMVYGSDWEEADWLAENEITIKYLEEKDIVLAKIPHPQLMSTTTIIERAALSVIKVRPPIH